MDVTINGLKKSLHSNNMVLKDLLKLYSLKYENLVIECNSKIVSIEQYDSFQITNNDVLNIFSFVGGG